MQTQCPHCDTRFRVTESQVNMADGFVRCSVCKEVFNAFEAAEQHEYQPSLLKQESSENESSVTESNDDTALNNESRDDIEDLPEIEAVDFNEASATDDSRKDAFDFFDEEVNESLPHVVPEHYKESYASNSSTLASNLLWGTVILLLTATLFVEYIWFNRDQLNQIPQMQAWKDKLCQHIECKNIAVRNPKKIELIARNVYSHPNEKNALMVNITMKNNADFAQPYPVMQISFSDIRGGNVAARRFSPKEYLPAEIQQSGQQLLESDTNMTFSMEIQDPGKQAMTYEFDFL